MQQQIALIVAQRDVRIEGEEFTSVIEKFMPLVKDFVPTLDDIRVAQIEDGVLVPTVIEGITVITDYHFVMAYAKKLQQDMWEPDYAETGAVLKHFAEQVGCSYYAAPKEDFFIFKGVAQAQAEGKKYVIVENMS
jgi:hypothetical protein